MGASGIAGAAFRSVARELALSFLAVFALVLTVGLGARFIGFLQEAATGRFAAEALWPLLALRVPEFVQTTAPFAFCLALLLTFGRLHAEREFVALTMAGAGIGRIVLWLLACATPVAAAVAALSLFATPEARRLYASLSLEQLVDSELDAMIPGVFHVFSEGDRVTYAQEVDRDANVLTGVFMGERSGERSATVWAERGRQHRAADTGSRFLVLENGVRYEGAPGDADYRVARFKRLGQRLRREPPAMLEDVRQLPSAALDARHPRQAAEWQWRLALPVMTFVVGLLALGIARAHPRAGRFARLLPGVGLFAGYYLLLVTARGLVADEAMPAALGLWAVHGAGLALGCWLVRRSARPT